MFSQDNPKFKIVVSVALYPEGVPAPEIIAAEPHQIAQMAIECIADPHGVTYAGIDVAMPPQHAAITDVGARALSIMGDALHEVATGDKTNITGEELRHYHNGELVKVTPVSKPH